MRTVGMYFSRRNSTKFLNKVGIQKKNSIWWSRLNQAIKYPRELIDGTASQHSEF